jgi:D-sedoheptulose 7-phosphate isomerase
MDEAPENEIWRRNHRMHRQLVRAISTQPEKTESVSVEAYFQVLSQIIPRLPYDSIDRIAAAIIQAVEADRTIFVFGNGGSAAIASHVVCDLNKTAIHNAQSRRVKVIALTDNVPLLTAWANDAGYEHVFSEQLKNFVRARDIAFAISGSGDSPNVLLALKTAREAEAVTVGIAGYEGGRMKALCDICAVVPSDNMQMIEDLHQAVAHSIFTVVRENLRVRQHKMRAAGASRAQE